MEFVSECIYREGLWEAKVPVLRMILRLQDKSKFHYSHSPPQKKGVVPTYIGREQPNNLWSVRWRE